MKKNKKTILITGGAGRMGSDLAANLLKEGHNVILGDLNKSELLKIKKKLKSQNLLVYPANLSQKKNIDKFINFGLKKFKKIHGAVHCAYPRSKKWGKKFEDLESKISKVSSK